MKRFVRGMLAVAMAAVTGCSASSTSPNAVLVLQDGGATDGGSAGSPTGAGGDTATADTTDGASATDAAGAAEVQVLGDGSGTSAVDSSGVGDGGFADAFDWDLLDPEDSEGDATAADTAVNDTATPPVQGLGAIFAHTSSVLYRLENKQFSKVGTFQFNKAPGSVTDIALDDGGALFAVTFNDVFQCDKSNAKCTWLAALPQQFNGLTFVAKDVVVAGKAALIGIANSGDWNLIEVSAGVAKVKKLGSYGGYASSGDAFSVEGVGTYATVKGGFGGSDKLVEVNPATGSVTKVVGDTGVSDLWGVAWQAGTLYGFTSAGPVYELDMKTGKASVVSGLQLPAGASWWGAGVSTRAADD